MTAPSEEDRLARTYVWWQDPALTLAEPRKLLIQILRYGRPEDYVAAERIWGEASFREALISAQRGDLDAKSEYFWKLRFDITSAPAHGN